MNDRLTMKVPGKPEYVGTVRIAAAHIASHAGFDIEAIDDIKIAVSEACTNTINHACKTPDFTYEVFFEMGSDGLTITVKDSGVGFVAEKYEDQASPCEPGRGLGLFIIKALMDEVEFRSMPGKGADIKMTKYLPDRVA